MDKVAKVADLIASSGAYASDELAAICRAYSIPGFTDKDKEDVVKLILDFFMKAAPGPPRGVYRAVQNVPESPLICLPLSPAPHPRLAEIELEERFLLTDVQELCKLLPVSGYSGKSKETHCQILAKHFGSYPWMKDDDVRRPTSVPQTTNMKDGELLRYAKSAVKPLLIVCLRSRVISSPARCSFSDQFKPSPWNICG